MVRQRMQGVSVRVGGRGGGGIYRCNVAERGATGGHNDDDDDDDDGEDAAQWQAYRNG